MQGDQLAPCPIGVRRIVDRLSVLQGHVGHAPAMQAPVHLDFDEATYDLFMSYFVPPTPDEGFNVIVHTP